MSITGSVLKSIVDGAVVCETYNYTVCSKMMSYDGPLKELTWLLTAIVIGNIVYVDNNKKYLKSLKSTQVQFLGLGTLPCLYDHLTKLFQLNGISSYRRKSSDHPTYSLPTSIPSCFSQDRKLLTTVYA